MRTLTPIMLSLAVMALLFSCESEQMSSNRLEDGSPEDGSQLSGAFQTIAEPFEAVKISGEVLRIEDPSQPSHFELPGGTTIDVPANAFADVNGQAVQTPVELRFREFHEAAEIIASGIPMRVKNEDGSEGWMQTAGMFEIRAESDGQEVDIADGQSVEIGFVSAVDGNYDFWFFDEADANWLMQKNSASAEPVSQARGSAEATQARLRQLEQNPPQNPEVPESEMLGFTDLDVSQIPELNQEETVLLAYAGKDPEMSPANNAWVRDAKWLRKKIEPTAQEGIYRLTLLGERRYSIPVKPVLKGEALEQAKARYGAELEAYNAKVAALQDRNRIKRDQERFRRTISVEAGGIYNYDILLKMSDSVPLLADFDFGDNLPNALQEAITVYLVTGDNRAVISLPKHSWNNFRFLPDMDNKLIAALPGGKVVVFPQARFDKEKPRMLNSRGEQYTFDMTGEQRQVRTLEDLRSIIQEAS